MMKTVIVYYSLTGNTAWAARHIADALGAELLELKPKKAYPDHGFLKYLRGGKSAMAAECPCLEPYEFDHDSYGCIIFASPLWASRITPPLRTFLIEQREKLTGKRFAAVICCGGGKSDRAFAQLQDLLGTELDATLCLVDPQDRPSAGNDNLLEAFCRTLNPDDWIKEKST